MNQEINTYYVFGMLWFITLCILLLFADSNGENGCWKPMIYLAALLEERSCWLLPLFSLPHIEAGVCF